MRILSTLLLAITASLNAQVILQPTISIQAAVDSHPAGTTFTLLNGTYRLQSIVPKNNDVFQGNGAAILKGSKVLSSFTTEVVSGTSYYVATGQTQDLGAGAGTCSSGTVRCDRPEALYMDGTPLIHRTTLAGVAATGEWFFDYAADKIYFRFNPTGHMVETSVTKTAFSGTATGVTINNLIIEQYATPNQYGTVGDGAAGANWTVTNNEIRYNNGMGLRTGTGMTARGNYIHHQGEIGAGGSGDNILFESNELSYNNVWNGVDPGWEGGANKFTQTLNLTVRRNYSHHNTGQGLWTDISNKDCLYEQNRVENNIGVGIFHEIGYACIIRYNIVRNNGANASQSWYEAGQIKISSSQDVQVYGNFIEVGTGINDAYGIIMVQQNRSGDPAPYGALRVNNIDIHGNFLRFANASTLGVLGGVEDYTGSGDMFASTISIDSNEYHLQTGKFAWSNAERTFAQFQGLGFEAAGTYDTNTATNPSSGFNANLYTTLPTVGVSAVTSSNPRNVQKGHPRLLINNYIPDRGEPTKSRLQAVSDRVLGGDATARAEFNTLQTEQRMCPSFSGTVNTNGTTTVTWVSGIKFLQCWKPHNFSGKTITSAMNASQTFFIQSDASTFGTWIVIDQEWMSINTSSGTTMNVTRGLHGSTAASHSSGAVIYYIPHEMVISGAHYVVAAVASDGLSMTLNRVATTATGATATLMPSHFIPFENYMLGSNTHAAIAMAMDYGSIYQIHHFVGDDLTANGWAASAYDMFHDEGTTPAMKISQVAVVSNVMTVTLASPASPALVVGTDIGVWGTTDDALSGGFLRIATVPDSTHFTVSKVHANTTDTSTHMYASNKWRGASQHGEAASTYNQYAYFYDHCYDWLVENGHDLEMRDEIVAGYWSNTITRGSTQFLQQVRESDFHNYTSWTLAALMENAVAIYGDDAFGATMLDEAAGYFFEGVNVQPSAASSDIFEFNLKKSVDALTGGNWNWEGPTYWRNSAPNTWRALESYDSATGRTNNIWTSLFSTSGNSGWYHIYTLRPDGNGTEHYVMSAGDQNNSSTPAGRDMMGMAIVNDRFPDAHFLYYLNHESGYPWNSGNGYGYDAIMYKLIFYPYNSGLVEHDYTDLPLSRKMGPDTVLRSGWGANDTFLGYSTSLPGTYHRHEDAGTFTLVAKGKPMVLGQPYTLEEPVYSSYNRRTIGANTLRIYDPNDCWINDQEVCGSGIYQDLSNDGGQLQSSRRLNPPYSAGVFGVLRTWSGSVYSDSNATIYNQVAPVRQATLKSGTGFHYVTTDLTPYYRNGYSGNRFNPSPKVASSNGVGRQIVMFTHSLGTLDATFVFDGVTSVDASFHKTWNIHVNGAPTVDGVTSAPGDTPYTNAAVTKTDTGTARLYVAHLLPTTPKIRTVGGNACVGTKLASCTWSYYVDQFGPPGSGGLHAWGSSMDAEPSGYTPEWRIEESPASDSSLTDYFLNVFLPTTTSTGTVPGSPTLFTGTNVKGGYVTDSGGSYVAAFSTAPPVTSMSYTASHPAGAGLHVVTGLAVGSYDVAVRGTSIGSFTADTSGVLSFPETGGGAITINQTGGAITLSVIPTTYSKSCTIGGGNPSDQSLTFSADGLLDNWTATETASWLSLSPGSGTTAANITASINCTGLSAGTYTHTISIASTTAGVGNSPITVGVTLTVNATSSGGSSFGGNITPSGNYTWK